MNETMKQEQTISISRAIRQIATYVLETTTGGRPFNVKSALEAHDEEMTDPDDETGEPIMAKIYGTAVFHTCEGVDIVPTWTGGSLRQTIGTVDARDFAAWTDGTAAIEAACSPGTENIVRHGTVTGRYLHDTFNREPHEMLPHLHRSGTPGHFDADLILSTDRRGRSTLSIVNRDIPFVL